jgi:malic enzyme
VQAGRIFPVASRMREVAARVAAAVAALAWEQGHAAAPRPADLPAAIAQAMVQPHY